MKIIDKIMKKQVERGMAESITIVCLGDSVTEGCFDAYLLGDKQITSEYDRMNSYSAKLQRLLAKLYPKAQINVINSGRSGGWAGDGAKCLERDVLRFAPDLVIVSYGINDSQGGMQEGLEWYEQSLSSIFERVKAIGAEIIFLTENYMCTEVSPHIKEESIKDLAKEISERQNSGILEVYFDKAKEICARYGVVVCDLYSVWKAMERSGVNITDFVMLNHPVREYHDYIAIKLVEMMLL